MNTERVATLLEELLREVRGAGTSTPVSTETEDNDVEVENKFFIMTTLTLTTDHDLIDAHDRDPVQKTVKRAFNAFLEDNRDVLETTIREELEGELGIDTDNLDLTKFVVGRRQSDCKDKTKRE